ncbi:S8/S53 family peptidase [Chitinophagaceae bacterium MMS25-I14]
MRKFILTTACLFAGWLHSNAQETKAQLPGLSPFTKQYLQAASKPGTPETQLPGYVYKHYNGQDYISALIKTGTGFDPEALRQQGVITGTIAGNIRTVQVPLLQFAAFTRTPGLAYIQLDEPLKQNLDTVRKYTHVDSVQKGTGLPKAFLGKNVVLGVVDVGFDYSNPVLRDTSGAFFRVKKVWEQQTSGTPPAGFIYGRELTDSAAMWTAGTDNGNNSHGMHVAGIAGGSGYGSSNNIRYRGMAPATDIVLVGILPPQSQWITTGGTDIIDGVNYVFQYATSVGKPAVVNLSWGASLGPHDGTSLFCEAMDNLTGAGKIFVTAAGNDGENKGHLQKTFTAADTIMNTFATYDTSVKKTWVDIWGDTAKTFCVKVTLYNGATAGNTTGFVCMDTAVHQFALVGSNNDTCFVSITGNPSEFNQKPRAFVNLYSRVADSVCITVKATSGAINMWNRYVEAPTGYESIFTSNGRSWALNGDTIQSISDNASGKTAVTVGAYTTKISWRAIGGFTYSYGAGVKGNIAPFSSTGPTQDNRMKPDITAPGFGVISSVNSYDPNYQPGGGAFISSVISQYHQASNNRDYYYAIMAGTSMASPAAAGIIALLLEANPALTPAQVKDILAQTAIHDNFTGTTPGNTWGAGKINAYQAVKKALQSTSVENTVQATLACKLYPNPGNGNFTIGFLGEKSAQLQTEVFDIAGHRIYADTWRASNGYSTHNIALQQAAKGVYLVKVSAPEGSSVLRLVVE